MDNLIPLDDNSRFGSRRLLLGVCAPALRKARDLALIAAIRRALDGMEINPPRLQLRKMPADHHR
jgi:hypothetical protein